MDCYCNKERTRNLFSYSWKLIILFQLVRILYVIYSMRMQLIEISSRERHLCLILLPDKHSSMKSKWVGTITRTVTHSLFSYRRKLIILFAWWEFSISFILAWLHLIEINSRERHLCLVPLPDKEIIVKRSVDVTYTMYVYAKQRSFYLIDNGKRE